MNPRSKTTGTSPGGIWLIGATLALVLGCSTPEKATVVEELPAEGATQPEPAVPLDDQLRAPEMAGIKLIEAEGKLRRFAPGTYLRPSAIGDGAVLHFADLDGLTLDLSGVELRGQVVDADLDQATGFGIMLRNCKNIEVKGATIGGYKVCVAVENCTNIRVSDMRCDGWYGQRLRSTRYSEDLTDWLRPRENDHGEWRTNYGAAIAVENSSGIVIENCRGRRGQNGILLTEVTDSKLFDNDFSFLSGWGLGMYRSSDNVVAHNVFDYCVRGFSHDVYWRGQDSAGILMFESCSNNLVARNSATHCGDGVFLYGGNDIVERGLPDATGSNDNVFAENDLRHAVANSLEATFSSGNAVLNNDLSGSHQHGVWGGYSREMLIRGNTIDRTIGGAITIEHGQHCVMLENHLALNEMGVELYWDSDPALVDGPFGRSNDTSSRDHWILRNTFEANVLDVVVRQTQGVVFHANTYRPGTREPYFANVSADADATLDSLTVQRWLDALNGAYPSGNLSDTTLNPWVGHEPELVRKWADWSLPKLPGSHETRAESRDEFGGGLESIVMTEWGPWDFRSGEPRPKERQAGGLLAQSSWNATWFRWKPNESDPRTSERAWRSRANSPIIRDEVPSFVNPWSSEENRRAIGNDFFGLFAATNLILEEAGTFELSVVSDDGIRVFVNEELVLEDWTLHAPKRDERTLELDKGEHIIRIEYFQIQGAAALVLELRRS